MVKMFRNSKLYHIYLNFEVSFTSHDFERQQLLLENWRLLKRNKQEAKIIHTQDQAHDMTNQIKFLNSKC